MLKLISVVLSFSLIFSSVAPSYAAGVFAQQQEEAMREQIEQAISDAQEAQEISYESQVKLIFEQVNTLINPPKDPNFTGYAFVSDTSDQNASRTLRICGSQLAPLYEEYSRQGKADGEYLREGYVCTAQGFGKDATKICSNAGAFAQVCASIALDQRWDGKGELKAKKYSARFHDAKVGESASKNFTAYAYTDKESGILASKEGDDVYLVDWLNDYWTINNPDKAIKYLIQLLHIPNVCTKVNKDGDPFDVRTSECELSLKAMKLLTGVAQVYPNYKSQVADEVYTFMKNKHREALASGTVLQGTMSLMALNTDKSYKYLTDFLDKETNPSILQRLGEISIEGVVDAIAPIGAKRTYYHNAYTSRFNYMDPNLLRKWYSPEYFKHPVMNSFSGEDRVNMVYFGKDFSDTLGVYQFPYGNIYEDIGVLIAKDSANNARSAKLAKTIYQDAIDAREQKTDPETNSTHLLRFPRPLFAGVLLGGFGGADGKQELNTLAATNFIDMNEGTQRRFRMNIDKALKTPAEAQKIDEDESAYQAFIAQYVKEDKSKYDDYSVLMGAKRIAFGMDLMLIAYFSVRILTGLAKWVGSLGSVLTKSVQGLRAFATKGFARVGKQFGNATKNSQRLAFRTKAAAPATATGATVKAGTTGAKAGKAGAKAASKAAGSSAANAASKTGSATKSASSAAQTAAAGSNEGKTIVLKGFDAVTGHPILEPLPVPEGLRGAMAVQTTSVKAQTLTAAIGQGGGATAASASTKGMTSAQATARINQIKNELKVFKNTSLQTKFNTALNSNLKQIRAANKAAGKTSVRLNEWERLEAYEKAFSEVTKDIDFLDVSAMGRTGISPQVASTAYTLNNEMQGMKVAGRTPRIWTDADIPWTLRARLAAENFLGEMKLAGQGTLRAAKNPQGFVDLVALAGMINPAMTGDAIKAAQIFAETTRPAIVMVADTEHAGTLSVRMLTATGLEMPAKPITMAASKLPITLMPWEEAYKILTPVFVNAGFKTYDEVFSEEGLAKAFEANPEAALAYYTFDKTAEREIFNAFGSGRQLSFKAPTEIVAEAPASSPVLTNFADMHITAKLPIDVTNSDAVARFTTRVFSPKKSLGLAAVDLTGGLGVFASKWAAKRNAGKYQDVVANYLKQAAVEAQRQIDADPSIPENLALLNGVEKVLSQDNVLPEEIKDSFVEEIANAIDEEEAAAKAEQAAFEVADLGEIAAANIAVGDQVIAAGDKLEGEDMAWLVQQAGGNIPLNAQKGVLFRGMALNADGDSLKEIFTEGLLLKRVTALAGALITAVGAGINRGAVSAGHQRTINLTNSPQSAAKWGLARITNPSKQIVVVTEVTGLNALDKEIVNYPYDIAPENISAVYALLKVDGKPTWCRVALTERGTFKITPVKVIETESETQTAQVAAAAQPVTRITLPEDGDYADSAAAGTTRGEAVEEAVDDVVTPKTGVEAVVEEGINSAKQEYQALGVQNVNAYVSLLVPAVKGKLEAAGIVLNDTETIQAVNKGLLAELGENHLLRQQAVDAITGRELSTFKRFWRWMATKVTGKMVNLDESDLLDLSNHVLKALVQDNVTINYDALRSAIQSGATLVKTEQGSYQETEKDGHVLNRSYNKETHDFSRILAQFTPAALQFTPHSEQYGFRPRLIETDVKGFPYLYTAIKLKMVEKDATGHTLLRKNIYTVVLSDDASLFKSLKENQVLVVDTYGNLYKSTPLADGKEKREPIFDRKVSVVKLGDLNDMPVVVLQKTQNRMTALNSVYQAMGLSSTGRFLNSFLADQYGIEGGALAGGHASGTATAISTGVYFTNIAPLLGLHQAVEKFGGKKVLNVALTASILCSLGVAAINAFGGNPHGWITLAPIIAAIGTSGLASAAIQQISNPTAQSMLGGKEAGYIVAGGQLQKTIGSLMTYAFASLAIILTGNWEFMYGLIAIPTLRALWAINVADLPLPAPKKATAAADKNSVAARTKEGKLSSAKFFLDPKILALFAGLMFFCGSETQASTATKSIITGLIHNIEWLQPFVMKLADALSFMPWVSAEGMDTVMATSLINDSIGTLISGMATMLPVLFGRSLAKKLMKDNKTVAKYNEKMWLISGVGIAASLLAMYIIGPQAGMALLPLVILANGLLGNMFTFTFNMMKNHDKEKYNNAFSTTAGSLSTVAVVGCFLIPTFTNFIIPGKGLEVAFQQLIVPILGVTVALLMNFRNFANPFDWKKPMTKAQVSDLQTNVIAQMALLTPQADLSEMEKAVSQANPDLTQEEVHSLVEKNVKRLKTELASAMGLSAEELVALINGTLDKELSESAFRRLADELNVKFKSLIKDDSVLENRIINQLMLQINAAASKLADEHIDETEGLEQGEENP